ncbi:MAG: hypothetical protein GQ583_05110 [Methyloprofundus sp.]|nr:hypothetical protein [Methyloprofundus sp.]
MSTSNILNIELSLAGMEWGISCTIPKIKIYQNQLPTATKELSLLLEDIDLINLPHGMHCIDVENSDIILNNEFKIMPLCPPSGKSHHYRLTVRAFDADHQLIGTGTAIQQFP